MTHFPTFVPGVHLTGLNQWRAPLLCFCRPQGVISRADLDHGVVQHCKPAEGDNLAEQLQKEEDRLYMKMYGPRISDATPHYHKSFAMPHLMPGGSCSDLEELRSPTMTSPVS